MSNKELKSHLSIQSDQFFDWFVLNDSIMGGNSQSTCKQTSEGLLLEGFLVEEGGGFISCISNVFSKPLDLSSAKGIEIAIDGYGRKFKFAISSSHESNLIVDLFPGRLKWVAEFNTAIKGTSFVKIPFNSLRPTIRSKILPMPLKFQSSSINQLQILHSKFGIGSNFNPGFKPGDITFLLRSICDYK